MKVLVRLDRVSRRWWWESAPVDGSVPERSLVDYPTVMAAMAAARERFGPGLTIIV